MSFVWSLKKLICERREEGGRDDRVLHCRLAHKENNRGSLL